MQSRILVTERMPLPGGGSFWLKLDLGKHALILETSQGQLRKFSYLESPPAAQFGGRVLRAVKELGLEAEYERHRYESDLPGRYDPHFAAAYHTALVNADRIFKKHRAALGGNVGPVQLWPHGFDLAFEWFGTRQVEYEQDGTMQKTPSQLSLGFAPGDASHPEPYFYSNPWPFEADRLAGEPLPHGARWFSDGWQGSLLPYAQLVGARDAEQRLLAYARAIYDNSFPTLTN